MIYAGFLHILPESRSQLYPLLIATLGSALVGHSAWHLAQRERSRGASLMALSFGLAALVLAARGLAVLLSDATVTSVSPGPSQLLMALGGLSIVVIGHLGFVNHQFDRQVRARIEAEQRRARAEERELQSQERAASLQALIDERELLLRRLQRIDTAQQLAVVAAALPHELRQPLGAIRIHLDLLIQEFSPALPSAGAELLARLDRSLHALAAIIDEHMRLLQDPDAEQALEPVDLAAVVQDALEVVAARTDICHIDVNGADLSPLTVYSKAGTLRQVLLILLANAIDALADLPAPRRLSVALQITDSLVRLQLQDNGPGIPVHVLPHLFQPFSGDKADGLGIGLALAWRLAQRCGARLSVQEVEPEQLRPGTTFTLTLATLEPGSAQPGVAQLDNGPM